MVRFSKVLGEWYILTESFFRKKKDYLQLGHCVIFGIMYLWYGFFDEP